MCAASRTGSECSRVTAHARPYASSTCTRSRPQSRPGNDRRSRDDDGVNARPETGHAELEIDPPIALAKCTIAQRRTQDRDLRLPGVPLPSLDVERAGTRERPENLVFHMGRRVSLDTARRKGRLELVVGEDATIKCLLMKLKRHADRVGDGPTRARSVEPDVLALDAEQVRR